MTVSADRRIPHPRVAECEACPSSSEQVLNMTWERSGRLLCLTCQAERAQYGAAVFSPETIYLANIADIYGGRPQAPFATPGNPACAECGGIYRRNQSELREDELI